MVRLADKPRQDLATVLKSIFNKLNSFPHIRLCAGISYFMRKVIFLTSILMLQVRLSCFHLMDYFTLTAVVRCMGKFVHFVQVPESSS
jgi:hypothetical protein